MSDPHPPSESPKEEPLGPPRLVSQYTDGGHEVDQPPNVALFAFLAFLVILVIGAGIGVYQIFAIEVDSVNTAAASQQNGMLGSQMATDEIYQSTFGTVDYEGEQVAYRVPIRDASQQIDAVRLVLRDKSRFAAAPAPEGWVHPDDL